MNKQDENIRRKINELSNENLPFEEVNLWQRLEERLDKKSSKIMFFSWQRWVAAATILLFLSIGFVVFQEKNKEKFTIDIPKNNSQKNISTDNQLLKKNEKPNVQAQEIIESEIKHNLGKVKDFDRKLNIEERYLTQINLEKTESMVVNEKDISTQRQIIQVNEIQLKSVALNTKEIDIKAPIIVQNDAVEIQKKPHRRLAFRVRIFPSLTSPDTSPVSAYAYGESQNQIKIKF